MQRRPHDPDFKRIPPQSIYEFRDVAPTEQIFFPELSKNRKCTDVGFLIAFLIFVLGLIGLTIALALCKDIKKWWFGSDSCGNICGTDNIEITKQDSYCKPKNYINYSILLYTENFTECIETEACEPPEREIIFRRCFPKNTEDTSQLLKEEKITYEIFHTIERSFLTILIMLSSATGLSLLIYFCFLLSAYVTFLIFLIAAMGLSLVAGTVSWYMFLVKDQKISFLVPGIFGTIYLVAIIVLMLFLSNRFSLVSRLYAEATRIIFKAPIVLFQPILTLLFLLGLNLLVAFLLVLLYAKQENSEDDFVKVRPLLIFFIVLAVYWLFAVVNGCQCMIIGSVIAAKYFKRDTSTVRCPYFKSFWNIIRFHLGTIAVGSLVIFFLRILKPLVERIGKKRTNFCLRTLEECCAWLREMSEYYTKKTYVTTAIHGKNFHKSGRRSARLLWLFLCDMINIDVLGCAAMHALSFMITYCAMIVGLGISTPMQMKHNHIPLLIGTYISGTVTFFYISVMNVTIETLFVCFCEDRLLNTGNRYNPYFMSPNFFAVMIEALRLSYTEQGTGLRTTA